MERSGKNSLHLWLSRLSHNPNLVQQKPFQKIMEKFVPNLKQNFAT
jgi:hypothetical protein